MDCHNQIRRSIRDDPLFLPSFCEEHTWCYMNLSPDQTCFKAFCPDSMQECGMCTNVFHPYCIYSLGHTGAYQCEQCGVAACCVSQEGFSYTSRGYMCEDCACGLPLSFCGLRTNFSVDFDLGPCDNVCSYEPVTHRPTCVCVRLPSEPGRFSARKPNVARICVTRPRCIRWIQNAWNLFSHHCIQRFETARRHVHA